jgi:hypothetical protein
MARISTVEKRESLSISSAFVILATLSKAPIVKRPAGGVAGTAQSLERHAVVRPRAALERKSPTDAGRSIAP